MSLLNQNNQIKKLEEDFQKKVKLQNEEASIKTLKDVLICNDRKRWNRFKRLLSDEDKLLSEEEKLINIIVDMTHNKDLEVQLSKFFFNLKKNHPDNYNLFFNATFNIMKKVAHELPTCNDIELLKFNDEHVDKRKESKTKKVKITRRKIFCLLIHAFFCTFDGSEKELISGGKLFSFEKIYSFIGWKGYMIEKLNCFINYFNLMAIELISKNDKFLEEKVSFKRSKLNTNFRKSSLIDGLSKKEPLGKIKFMNGKIEDYRERHSTHLDFANRYIGGGALGRGCVQEEILFLIKPECIVSGLIAPVMKSDECIILGHCIQYSTYSGYSSSFKFKDSFENFKNTLTPPILAIDALKFNDKNSYEEYKYQSLKHEFLKLYIGFISIKTKNVCTGNWGCGAFLGTLELKMLIQWIAFTQAKLNLRNRHNDIRINENNNENTLIYFGLDNNERLKKFANELNEKTFTINQLFKLIYHFGKNKNYKIKSGNNLIEFLLNNL